MSNAYPGVQVFKVFHSNSYIKLGIILLERNIKNSHKKETIAAAKNSKRKLPKPLMDNKERKELGIRGKGTNCVLVGI